MKTKDKLIEVMNQLEQELRETICGDSDNPDYRLQMIHNGTTPVAVIRRDIPEEFYLCSLGDRHCLIKIISQEDMT